LAAVAALALTGCVDNSAPEPGSSAGNGAGGESSAPAIAKDDAAAALVPDAVAKDGKLVIGTDAAYPPNEYKDESGNPIGWGIEISNAIAGKLGLQPSYQVSKFDNIIPSITGGKVDIGESSFTDNPEREKQVDFVNYYTAGIQWASKTGTDIDPDNACGLKVAVQATTVEDTDEIPAKNKACLDAGKAAIQVQKYDSQDEATNAVVLGKADALSADSPVTFYAISKTNGKLQPAGKSFDVAPYGIATQKGSDMTKAVQAALQSMLDDGSYMDILKKWGVEAGALDKITVNAATKG